MYDLRPRNTRPFPLRKVFSLILVTLVFGGIFYFLFLSGHFEIKSVDVEGIKTIQNEEILAAVDFVLSQKKFGILSLKNSILLQEEKLQASLRESFPKILSIEIKKISPDGLKITISEREVSGIWCGANCFYFDEEGVGFEESPRSVGSLILSIVDERKETRELGDTVLVMEQAEFFRDLKELIDNNFSFAIKNFTIRGNGGIELLTSGGWRILLDRNASAEFQLSNLKYIFDEEIKTRQNELEYVDLRLGNRVYYKYRDY